MKKCCFENLQISSFYFRKQLQKKKIAVAPQLFKIVFDMDQEFLGYQSKFSEALRQVKKKQISAQIF